MSAADKPLSISHAARWASAPARPPIWLERMGANERRAMTPLFWGHVNPYGTFQLDMTARLPLDPPMPPSLLARIIRSHPLTLRRHESHSISGCADMSSRGHFPVVVAGGLGLGWRLTERAMGGAAAPRFRRSGAANVPASV